MAITTVLKLDMKVTASDLAQMARDEASMFDGGDTVPNESREILLTLNKGLETFLTGEYAASQPSIDNGDDEDIAEKWVQFANHIASGYTRIKFDYPVFHWVSNLPEAVKEHAEEAGMQGTLPAFIWNAIDWATVSSSGRTKYEQMSIDGATFVTGIHLSD